jgi:Ser/Thr protein kinase RdoA (MazF antagonist)
MDFFNLDTEKFILAAGKENYEYYQSIINEIKKLPTNKNNYGMIHGDFGVNNLFMDWDDLWVFDFGDCCYSFYIYYICTILSSLYMTLNKNNDLKSFSKYAKEFRSAYEKDNKLPKEEWKSERAKLFIQLRLISNLSILLKHINKDSDAYKYVSLHIDAIEKIKNTSAIDLFLGEYI